MLQGVSWETMAPLPTYLPPLKTLVEPVGTEHSCPTHIMSSEFEGSLMLEKVR